jgi:hypothetical protein
MVLLSPNRGQTESRVGPDALNHFGGLDRSFPLDEEELGFFAGLFEYLLVAEEIADAEFGKAGLLCSEKFARAADLEILFGDEKTGFGRS